MEVSAVPFHVPEVTVPNVKPVVFSVIVLLVEPFVLTRVTLPVVPLKPRVGVAVSAGVAPAMILPAAPLRSSVVADELPPTAKVLLGDVIVSPPPPDGAQLLPVCVIQDIVCVELLAYQSSSPEGG